jgi:hypothetical protein
LVLSISTANASVSHAEVLRTREKLTSRDAMSVQTTAGQAITGRLAMVTDDNAPINAPREQYGRLLSRVPKGTYLIVTGETDDFYAVVMADQSLGFIAKKSVQMLDYQITAPVTGSLGSASPLQQSLVQTAMQYLGVPYVYGGTTANGIDCSAFVQNVYATNGLSLPRTAAQQAQLGYSVSLNDVRQWQPGDRMYFQCHHNFVDHAGMYIGNGYFVQSSISGHGVAVTQVSDPYYFAHLVVVRRSPQLVQTAQAAQSTPALPDPESSQE